MVNEWKKIKADKLILDSEISKFKTNIQQMIDKSNYFKYSDSSVLFKSEKKYKNLEAELKSILKGDESGMVSYVTPQENADKYWENKDFRYFNYKDYISESNNDKLKIKYNNLFSDFSNEKQYRYDDFTNRIENLLSKTQRYRFINSEICCKRMSVSSSHYSLEWDYDCILNDFKNPFTEKNISTMMIIFFISCIVLVIGRYIVMGISVSYHWVVNNSKKSLN